VKYLLDTNAVIALLKGTNSALASKVRHSAPDDLGISAIVTHELYFGAFKSQRVSTNLDVLDRLAFHVLEFTREDSKQAGRVRAELAALGSAIGPYDVLIAGQAAERGLVLVTRNLKEFGRVSGLRCENWE
jgi:tRNA(fMet)-specific endonuclease VapC